MQVKHRGAVSPAGPPFTGLPFHPMLPFPSHRLTQGCLPVLASFSDLYHQHTAQSSEGSGHQSVSEPSSSQRDPTQS